MKNDDLAQSLGKTFDDLKNANNAFISKLDEFIHQFKAPESTESSETDNHFKAKPYKAYIPFYIPYEDFNKEQAKQIRQLLDGAKVVPVFAFATNKKNEINNELNRIRNEGMDYFHHKNGNELVTLEFVVGVVWAGYQNQYFAIDYQGRTLEDFMLFDPDTFFNE